MKRTLIRAAAFLAIAAVVSLVTVEVRFGGTEAQAAAPTGDYTRYDNQSYFSNNVTIDGTLIAAGLDCSETRSWSGGTISLNTSSNFAVNVGTGTSTGTVTLGGTGTQTIAIGNGVGVKTVALGSSTTTSSTTISAGTGDLVLTSVDDVTINGGSAGSLINIGTNADGNVLHIADDDTAADAITIGSAKDTSVLAGIAVTVGSTGTTSALTLQSGTGDVTVTSTDDINIGANASATDIDIGNTTGASSLDLKAGTGGMTISSTKNVGSCNLSSGTPSTCTATVLAGAVCLCAPVGTTAAIAAAGCAVSLSGTTLTITGPNTVTTTINYYCF